jgi:hypothetical protein
MLMQRLTRGETSTLTIGFRVALADQDSRTQLVWQSEPLFGYVQDWGQELREGVSRGPAVAEQGAAEGEHGLRAGPTPLHASLLHTLLNDDFTSGLDGAAANRAAGLTKFAIAHAHSHYRKQSRWMTNHHSQTSNYGNSISMFEFSTYNNSPSITKGSNYT